MIVDYECEAVVLDISFNRLCLKILWIIYGIEYI
jgi:hypothetical protein